MKTIDIRFGALVPTLREQILAGTGIDLNKNDNLAKLQKYSDACTLLSVNFLLTDGEVKKVRKRIMKKVCETIDEHLFQKEIAKKKKGL